MWSIHYKWNQTQIVSYHVEGWVAIDLSKMGKTIYGNVSMEFDNTTE